MAKGLKLHDRRMAVSVQHPTTPAYAPITQTSVVLERMVRQTLHAWEDRAPHKLRRKMEMALLHAKLAWDAAKTGDRSACEKYCKLANIRIAPAQWSKAVQTVLQHGFILDIPMDGQPTIHKPAPSDASDWGFNTVRLEQVEREIGWRDEQILDSKRNESAALAPWINHRKILFPNETEQHTPYAITVYQDDMLLLAVGNCAAALVEYAVNNRSGENHVGLSPKPEAIIPFIEKF